jgi:adenine deaminase
LLVDCFQNQFQFSVKITGHIVDIRSKKIYDGEITITQGKISGIQESNAVADQFILPGFIDAHVHIESSMLVPSEFARLAVVHGTVATVSDPHEIGNVLGVRGVEFMITNGKQVPFKFFFGAPSCVPATSFETAGAVISTKDIEKLMSNPEIKYLAEMMNWPGVLNRDEDVMAKIGVARRHGKPVDGHAPGLLGADAKLYADAGITTDHECFTYQEALNKLKIGMKVIIREGSAAKNFDALIDLLNDYPGQIMFCSDDKHPDSLEISHIDELVRRSLRRGIDLFNVLTAACLNPVEHYNLDVGTLRAGDAADFIVVNDLKDMRVLQTYIDGQLVAKNGKTLIHSVNCESINNFSAKPIDAGDLKVKFEEGRLRVIEVADGQLITSESLHPPKVDHGFVVADIENDILKIIVVNRYSVRTPAVGFIKNFGLKTGAIASSVAHDSHNIIAVGADDKLIAQAVNLVIEARGGISAVSPSEQKIVKLPVAGLMSAEDGYSISQQYTAIDKMAKEIGSTLHSPFMSLSFMALLVIPDLKLSDMGLFSGKDFKFTSLFQKM